MMRVSHDGGPVGAALGPGEQPDFSAQSHRPFILPVSGLRSRSIIAGTRCTSGAFGCITAKCGRARL